MRGICYVEREVAAAASLVASMEAGWFHPAPVWSDLATFDARRWRGLVHILASGDPCQDNSVAGQQAGADGERFLAPEVCRVAEECRPDLIFRENVPGNADEQLAAIVPPLERLGCRIAAGIFSSAEAGNTMRRERLFILAEREGDERGLRAGSENGKDDADPARSGGAFLAGPDAAVMNDGESPESWRARQALLKAKRINGNGAGVPLAIAAQEMSLWPGPMAGSPAQNGNNEAGNSDFSRKAMELAESVIEHWSGPKVIQGGANSKRKERGSGGHDLQEQVQRWPGPAARDFKGVNREVPTPDYNARPLNEVAADFLPPSSPARPIAGGSTSSTDGPNTNQPSVKRKLNPIFVEALMRWPTGLSGFERPATALIRWQLLMLSFVYELVSSKPEHQGRLL